MKIIKIAGLSITLTAIYFVSTILLLQFMGGIAFYTIPLFSGVLLAVALLISSDAWFSILAFFIQAFLFAPIFLEGKMKFIMILTMASNISCAYIFKNELLKKPMFQAPRKAVSEGQKMKIKIEGGRGGLIHLEDGRRVGKLTTR